MAIDPDELYSVPEDQRLDDDEPHTHGSHAGYPDHVDDIELGDVDFVGHDD